MAQVNGSHPGANYTEEFVDEFLWYDRIGTTISYVLCVIITSLNVFVLTTVLWQRRRRQSSKGRGKLHFFIINLAIADLLVGLVPVLGGAIESTVRVWYLGNWGCKVYRFLAVVLLCASNNLLIGMSVDRFLAIAFPMRTIKSGFVVDKLLVIGAWVISFIISIFFLVFSHGEKVEFGCTLKLPTGWWRPYLLTVAIVVYILPAVSIAACYIGICAIVWRKWKRGLGVKSQPVYAIKVNGVPAWETSAKNSVQNGLLPRAKFKSIKMTVAISLAFLFCWTPYFVSMMVDLYGSTPLYLGVTIVLGNLYPLNSAVNPLIFIVFNRNIIFRRSRPARYEAPRTITTSRSTTSLNLPRDSIHSNTSINLFAMSPL